MCDTRAPRLIIPKDVNIEKDCQALQEAMRPLDVPRIIDILGHRNQQQRLQIRDRYKSDFEQDLLELLQDVEGPHFKELLGILLKHPVAIKAEELHKAIKRNPPDEDTITEILCVTPKSEMEALMKAYKSVDLVLVAEADKDPSHTLERDLEEVLSADHMYVMKALMYNHRHEIKSNEFDNEQMKRFINDIRHFMDENNNEMLLNTLAYLFTEKSPMELEYIMREFQWEYRESIINVIGRVFSPGHAKLFSAICDIVLDPFEKRASTKDTLELKRMIVKFCEDHLTIFNKTFHEKKHIELVRWVHQLPQGHDKQLLLTLLGQ